MFDLRYLLAWHKKLRAQILSAVMRGLERHYVAQARAQGGQDPKYGAISVAQRMDGAVRLNVHFHILCADGAWVQTDNGVQFLQAPPLQQHVVEEVLADVLKRIGGQTAKLPNLIEDPGLFPKPDNSAMASMLKSAMLGHQMDGKDKGKPQRVEFGKHAPTIHSDLKPSATVRARKVFPFTPTERSRPMIAKTLKVSVITCVVQHLPPVVWSNWRTARFACR